MSNYAAIIDTLSVSGSRLTDGTPNASGKCWLFQPGTSTTVNAYSNATATTVVTQPITLGAGGRLPSELSGGLFVTQPVRLYIEDVSGNVVSDSVFIPATAGDTGVSNAGTTATTVDAFITKVFTSTGGTDALYKESSGATARTIAAKFAEIWISVKDFGAQGDGVAIDTTAIQAAMNRVKAIGGGVCYFPPGSYRHDQALTLTDADGVTIAGAGSAATILVATNGTADCFTFDTCNSLRVRGLSITHATTSTGVALSLTDCISATVEDVVHEGGNSVGYRFGVTLSSCTYFQATNSTLEGESSNAASRGILATDSGPLTVIGSRLEASAGYPFEAAGSTGSTIFVGTDFAGGSPRYAAALSGTGFVYIGCRSVGAHSVATAAIPVIRQESSEPFESSTTSAVGAAQTPSLLGGPNVKLTAASGGAGIVTVNAPAVLPTAAAGQFWDFRFVNASGGAVTWTLNAVFVTAAAIPATDGHTICVRFLWDGTELREMSRADTVT